MTRLGQVQSGYFAQFNFTIQIVVMSSAIYQYGGFLGAVFRFRLGI